MADFVRPAKAVTSAIHLHGRIGDLTQGRRGLRTEGSQIFIYGERGVGKTSLAKTLLAEIVPEHASDLLIACEKNSTFASLMQAVVKRLLPICKQKASATQIKTAFQAYGFTVEMTKFWQVGEQIDPTDINSFISVIKAIGRLLPQKIAVIVDEFDLIADSSEKEKFAELVKQLSDQEVSLKFIFCGIAADVESLIGGHYSSGRYIEPINLGPLVIGPIFSILDKACNAFGIQIEKEPRIRSALIVDGYPYFMHLITKNAIEILYEQKHLP
ncbi:MAG: AAA family ATPase [Parasphingorhabdus sp.]